MSRPACPNTSPADGVEQYEAVILFHTSLHSCVLNAPAPGGLRRDMQRMGAAARADLVARAGQQFAALGITVLGRVPIGRS